MSYTLQELVDRAISIATRGQDPSASPALAAEMVTEDLVAQVFQQVSVAVASDATTRQLLRRTNTVIFANGVGTLPQSILTQYLSESVLWDTASTTTRYSWEPQWDKFIRTADQRLGYYCVNEGDIAVVQPNASYSPSTGLSGSLDLLMPCAIAMPASATAAIVVRDELLDDLVADLAAALQGGKL